MAELLLDVRNLRMYFKRPSGIFGKPLSAIKAVDGISLRVFRGQTLGLVGESGCGKSTLGNCIMGLYTPTGGEIRYRGVNLAVLGAKEKLPYRRKMQMIFQDPYSSLNPHMTVMDSIRESLDIHGIGTIGERRDRVYRLLEMVGLNREHAGRYPHEFSGGQRQRVGIARALAVNPEFILCDEPISALDVSIQAQVVNMLEDLQQQLGLTYLFIAHDLSMVRHISTAVMVMYLGSVMEAAETGELYKRMAHPYTQALMAAAPVLDPVVGKQFSPKLIKDDPSGPLYPPGGCKFYPRCPEAGDRCREGVPELREIGPGHFAACYKI
ncbi:MAG: ABC transporter ATP-binding protein [Treponema sp.]|jgi:oligopeptide transport system ATP-binding protein|nr:ABC transporter ATP-binding protein [Treponema sp.]